jgi:amidase
MGFAEYAAYDALGLAELIRRRAVSPAEVLEAAIERIERHNPTLNAVVHRAYEAARQTALAPLPDGPFCGVPFLVKDLNCDVAGMPRTDGSVALRDHVPAADGELARRWRAAGLVLVGKTNTPEFGITGTTEGRLWGACRNPWNPARIAGGSSGGSAAAVASGMVPFAHASDGMGSIRIPASCCGLFGLKVTRDRNPVYPEEALRVFGLSVHHAVTRTVRDSAALLDTTGYPERGAPFAWPAKERPYLEEIARPPARLRIGFTRSRPDGAKLDLEVLAALENTLELLQALGHELEERELGVDQRALYLALGPISQSNMAAAVSELAERKGRALREEELEPLTWSIVESGRAVTGEQMARGWRALARLTRQLAQFFETLDVWFSPVMGTPPPPLGEIDPVRVPAQEIHRRQARAFPFTPPFNMTGQPAMSVPLAWSREGLPIGMQFAARYGDEATLLRLAAQLEQARPWKDRHPPVFG